MTCMHWLTNIVHRVHAARTNTWRACCSPVATKGTANARHRMCMLPPPEKLVGGTANIPSANAITKRLHRLGRPMARHTYDEAANSERTFLCQRPPRLFATLAHQRHKWADTTKIFARAKNIEGRTRLNQHTHRELVHE